MLFERVARRGAAEATQKVEQGCRIPAGLACLRTLIFLQMRQIGKVRIFTRSRSEHTLLVGRSLGEILKIGLRCMEKLLPVENERKGEMWSENDGNSSQERHSLAPSPNFLRIIIT